MFTIKPLIDHIYYRKIFKIVSAVRTVVVKNLVFRVS